MEVFPAWYDDGGNIMDLRMANVVLACMLSLVFTSFMLPKILLVSFRKRLFDPVDSRKVHQGIVPRLGGIAFMPACFFVLLLLLGVDTAFGQGVLWMDMQRNIVKIAFACCALMVLYLMGIIDDMIGVRYKVKFLVQAMCGFMLISAGMGIEDLHGLFGIHAMWPPLAWLLTLLLVVFIINAINLIDGIDGLASGLSIVAALYYGFSFLILGEYAFALVSFAVLGTLIPFFYYNVFGNANRGRKIFMGDTGSLTIGFILAFCSLDVLDGSSAAVSGNSPVVMAFAPLLVPCMDVVRVFLYRIRHGANPFKPDKNHIHHKLLAIGLDARWSLITILLISLCLTISNILLAEAVDVNLLLSLDIVLYVGFNLWLNKKRQSRDARMQASAKDCTEQ